MKSIVLAILTLALMGPAWALPPSGFIAHEWGTFTSLQDSDGNTVEGLAHEEESLPAFVHGREHSLLAEQKTLFEPSPTPTHPHCCTKDSEFPTNAGTPTAVTQKMETPVIYFYSQVPQSVKVDVDFPGGIITQYYPNVSSFSPALGSITSLANGHVHWDVDVASGSLVVPSVEEGSIWGPSRKTQSNFISSNGENEKLLFYRGLGNFKTELQVIDDTHGGLLIQNHSEQTIADAFLLRVTQGVTKIKKLGAVSSHGQIAITSDELSQLASGNALDLISTALERSGLYPDEAQAMVHTWERSYFKTPGLRVLYVLPREWTDNLLPLTIQPKPSETVRTLVGRVEVLTSNEEGTILQTLKSALQNNPTSSVLPSVVQNLGRFGESKLRRVLQIAQKQNEPASFITYIERLIHLSEQQ